MGEEWEKVNGLIRECIVLSDHGHALNAEEVLNNAPCMWDGIYGMQGRPRLQWLNHVCHSCSCTILPYDCRAV